MLPAPNVCVVIHMCQHKALMYFALIGSGHLLLIQVFFCYKFSEHVRPNTGSLQGLGLNLFPCFPRFVHFVIKETLVKSHQPRTPKNTQAWWIY